MSMNRRPLVWFAACWVAGSAAAAGLGMSGALLVAAAGGLLAIAAVAARQASGRLALACLLALCLAAGQRLWADARNVTELAVLLAAAEADDPRAAYAAEALGTIVSAVEVDGDRVQFRLEAQAIQAQGQPPLTGIGERFMVQLRLTAQPEQAIAATWRRGDRVTVTGELSRPATATNSGGFDYRRYLSSQRIHWLLKGTGTAAVAPAPAASPLSAAALLGRVDAARAWLGAGFDRLYPAEQAGYMKGLILGIREDLDPEQFGQFSRLGLTHILAISGLHVAVFMYATGGMLRLARLPRERILMLLMFAVPLYVLLTGGSPSVLRAGAMAVLGLAAARMGKLKDGLHLIAAAAVAMLLVNPYYLNDVSFQLSFIVTLGLIVGVPPLRRMMPQRKHIGWLLDMVAVTVVAQAVSFPVTIHYFNQFHLLSLPANFILVPFISFIVMPLGTASLILAPIWTAGGKGLAYAAIQANDWSFRLVDLMASFDSLRTIWKTPPIWWVAGWLTLLFALLKQAERWHGARLATSAPRHRAAVGAAGLLLTGMLLYGYWPDYFDRTATVSFLDVGQGDSALIRTAGGKHILIDGGGAMSFLKPGEEWRIRRDPFEVGEKVVVPLLMKRGVKEIDLLIVSHLDHDHIRGLSAVARHIPIGAVWWNGTMKDAAEARSFMHALLEADIPLYAPKMGDSWQADASTHIRVLWPPAATAGDKGVPTLKDQNENSVVAWMEVYGYTFLFAGDIGVATERQIMRMINEEISELRALDFMKAAHHGSRHSTSAEWLAYWKPFGAMVSAGAVNPYGHPHPDTIGRLEAAGARIWRTDTGGEAAFRIRADGISSLHK